MIVSRFSKHLPEVRKFQEEAEKELQEKLKILHESNTDPEPYVMEEMQQWAFSLEGDIKALNIRLDKIELMFKRFE